VGIIGLGVGERHLHGYQSNPGCEVVSLCDISEAKRAQIAYKYSDLSIHSQADAILNDPDIDVVSIASYDNDHFEQVAWAINNSKHVFVEKPICLHPKEAQHLRELLDHHPEVRLSCNLPLRMTPRFQSLKTMIEAGQLGNLYHVEGDYNYGRLHKITDGWRGQLDFYSVVYGGAVHMVDLLMWLTGDSIVEVSAFGNRICSEGTRFHFNDMVVSAVRFQSGMVGKVSANFGCVMPHYHGLTLYGTRGTFINGYDTARFYHSRDSHVLPEEINTEYPGAIKDALIHSFIDSIIEGTQPVVTADDVFRTMSVCFAIEKAAQQGGTVEVQYL